MHEYDVALKRILTRPGGGLLKALAGESTLRWINVELPKVSNLRVDLLGESPDGELVQFEFQSRNEKRFPQRMGEYLFAIERRYGQFPRQIVLYVGARPMRMKNTIEIPRLSYSFAVIDIRDLNGEALLASKNLSDNVVALLTRVGGQPDSLKEILRRIARGPARSD